MVGILGGAMALPAVVAVAVAMKLQRGAAARARVRRRLGQIAVGNAAAAEP